MSWLLIAIIAHLITAVVFLVDKFILSGKKLHPTAYAFYVGLLGGFLVFVLAPFGFSVLSPWLAMWSFVSGILFILAILCFYSSIRIGEISRVAPFVGGAVPVFSFVLSYFFLNERLGQYQLIAFFCLVVGGVIIAWPAKKKKWEEKLNPGFSTVKNVFTALLASFAFAGSFVVAKMIYDQTTFINGFIWIRAGGIIGALFILLWPNFRQNIFKSTGKVKLRTGGMAFMNKAMSAGAFILLNYAISLGSVSLVNALQGVQYLFLLILAVFLSKKIPSFIKEQISREIIVQKILAVILISGGLALLAF
jgi:drug/metabolite transporter (DMT)-like permease